MKALTMLGLFLLVPILLQGQDEETWVAPAEANKLENEFTSEEDIKEGKAMFDMYCSICHGETGEGDGPAGTGLPVPPRNFKEKFVMGQSDGALFWKLTNGRGNMVAYKEVLSEQQRWQLVSYIKTFSTDQ